MGFYDSLKRTTGIEIKNNADTSTGGFAAALDRTLRAEAEKSIIKSYDANNDSIVDIRDAVRAKKISNNSNEYAREINQHATDEIKKTLASPDFFSGDFNDDGVVDKKDEKIYEQNKKLREADVSALEAELGKLQEVMATAKAKKESLSNANTNTLTKKGAASVKAFEQKNGLQQDYDEYLKGVGYSSIEELQEAITEKTAFLNNAKRVQDRIKLSSVDDSSSENYDPEFDKYKEAGYEVSCEDVGSATVVKAGSGPSKIIVDDYRAAVLALYEYLGKEIPGKYKTKTNKEKISFYSEMEYDELHRLAYFLGKDKENGTETAKAYINAIKDELNYRKGKEKADDIKDKDILRYLYSVPAGLDQWASGMESLLNKEGEYKPTSATQYASAQIREEIAEEDGAVGTTIYDLGTTAANQLPSILVSSAANMFVPGSGAVIGAGLTAASAGGNAYQEMLNLGYDKGQAQTYGVLVGASEAALGYAFSGISALGGKVTGNALKRILQGIDNGFAKFAIRYGGSGLSENLEESTQALLEPLFENIALGYSKNKFEDIDWESVAYDGFLGMLSAGFLEFVPAVKSSANEVALARAEKLSFYGSKTDGSYSPENAKRSMQIMADEALADLDKDSEAYKIALKYKERLENNKKLSGTQLHELREVYESAIRENDKVKIRKAVAARLKELGETADISELSDIITRGVVGDKVSVTERRAVKTSKYGERVTNELVPDVNIKKEFSSYWTELIETERIHSDVYNKTETIADSNEDVIELENKILAKSDETLTPTERAIKQSIYERRSRQEGISADADTLQEQGKFKKPAEVQEENAESGNKVKREVVDLSNDNELSKIIGSLHGAEKYKKIRDYILGLLGGKNIKLSDGKSAIVDKSDALHIANKSGNKKTAQISQLEKIIKNAVLYAEDDNVTHKKFNYFYYYEVYVNDGAETYPIYLNVGKGINDGIYHIYDITKKIRDTAHRVNDVERPKPNEGYALKNDISNNKLTQNEPIVNNNISTEAENNSSLSKSLDDILDEGDTATKEAEEREPFTEPSTQEIYRKPSGEDAFLDIYNRSVKQRHITDIAKKLDPDMKIIWTTKDDARLSGKNGKFIRSTNTMYLAKDITVAEMYVEVFKHEFMHRLESRGTYTDFKEYLFYTSTAFEQYVRAQLRIINKGKRFEGSREEAIKALTKYYFDRFQNDKSIGKPLKDKFTMESAQREIVADFAGEVLFKGKANRESVAKALSNEDIFAIGEIESNMDALEELANTNRNLFQRIMDVIRDFIRILRGEPQTKSLVKDLEFIEQKLAQVYDSADKKSAIRKAPAEQNYTSGSRGSENLYNTPEHLKPITEEEWSEFNRSFANQTNGLKNGKTKSIIIHTSESQYIVVADGYMSGTIFIKNDIEDYYEGEKIYGSIGGTGFFNFRNEKNGNRQGNYDNNSNQFKNGARDSFYVELDAFIREHSEQFTNIRQARSNSEKKTTKSLNESFSIGSPMQQARENLAKYESGEISREEYLEGLEDNYLSREAEWARAGAKLKGQLKAKSKERAEVKAEVRAEREEKATKQSNIEHIRKTVSRIDKMFRTNSDKKHIPEKLKEASAYFIKIFVDNDASPFEKKEIRDIRTLYNDLIAEGDDGVEINGIDEKITETLKILEESLAGKTLRQLSYHEILLIKEITDNFYHIIQDENEVFLEGKKQKLAGIGEKCVADLKAKKAKKENVLLRQLDENIKYGNMIPIYFFEEIGGVLNQAFKEVVKGQNKWWYNAESAKRHISKLKKKYHYSDWDNETLKLTTEKGDKIEITREQAMLLLATARREYGNRYKDTNHLFRGGVVIPPPKETITEIVNRYNKASKKSDEDELNTRRQITREIDSRAHRITPKDSIKVLNWLTDEQVKYVEAMTDYLSNDMAALGNEVSMELAGIKKYGEKNYIPYCSAENFLFSQPGVNQEARLKNQSFTKDIQHRANTPIVLNDFSIVCADHINRMCMYNALTIPLENLNKIFNYQSKGEDRDTIDVKAEIARAYGQSAVKYITTFIKDMNGNVRNETTNSMMEKTLRLFKKGAVFASGSVVVQQPASVMRAMTYIPAKYFTETTFKFAERSFEEAAEWSALAGIKRMGRFDTGMGATTVEWLLYEKPEGIKEKTKAFFDINDSTYRDDILSAPAAKADELAWGHIWAAVKAEIADKTDLKPGTKEFFEACAERFDEVINYTQVYDSTISRSQNMRAKSISMQMLTAFMSEPTVTLNCLMKAIREAKTGEKEGVMFAGRALSALVGNVILNSLLKSLFTAGRDDDEDYTYLEKYAANVLQNIGSDMNIFSMMPYVKDIVSVFAGYSVDRADMSLFSDLAQSVSDINSNNKTPLQKAESLAGSLAAFLGLPVKNVLRDVRTVYNIVMDMKRNMFNGKVDSSMTGFWYALNESSNTEIFEDLAKAANDGDSAKYQRIYKHLSDNGKSDTEIISGIKSVFSDSKDIENATMQYIDSLQGNKTYELLDDEEKEKLQKDVKSKLALQKTMEVTSDSNAKFDTLYSYYRRGQTEKYNKLKKELEADGLTTSQISSGLEYARLSYMQAMGVDIHEYLLFKKATSKKYADNDESGGVDKSEKLKAINSMDIDSKAKHFFANEYK